MISVVFSGGIRQCDGLRMTILRTPRGGLQDVVCEKGRIVKSIISSFT